MRSKDYAYVFAVGAGAIAWGVVVGHSWQWDVEGLAVIGVITSMPYLKGLKAKVETINTGAPPPRSRIAHYANISRLRNPKVLSETAANDFERRLVSRREWKKTTDEQLRSLMLDRPEMGEEQSQTVISAS